MPQLTIPSDLVVQGNASFASLTVPPGAVKDANVGADAKIDSTKLIAPRKVELELFADAVTVAALTKNLAALIGSTGTVRSVSAWITTVATGADRTITIDLKKSTGGGAFATILSATIGFTNGSTIKTLVAGTITSASLVAGDLLRAEVTVAGAAGNQALGLFVALRYDESHL